MIVTILVVYFLYKLIFEFLVPVSKSASQIKNNFQEMQRKQEEALRRQQNNYQSAHNAPHASRPPSHPPKQEGDYIDFEEVK